MIRLSSPSSALSLLSIGLSSQTTSSLSLSIWVIEGGKVKEEFSIGN
jgi:hypothetical protein